MKTISKRFLKAAVAMLLVAMMLVSSTVTGLAAVVDNAKTNAGVDLAETGSTISEGAVVYLNTGGTTYWGADSAWFCAYFWPSGGNGTMVKMTNVTGNYYYAKAPCDADNVIFVRKNPSNTTIDWTDVWNKTGDLALDSTKNCYTISYWSGGDWSTYQSSSTTKLTASATTVDIGGSVTLKPSLVNYTTYNEIKSVTYSISPSTGASVSESGNNGTFTATAAGTYTVTAEITYNVIGFSSITKTSTKTATITVNDPNYTVTLNAGEGGTVSGGGTGSSSNPVNITAEPNVGYVFVSWSGGTAANFGSGSNTTASDTYAPTEDTTLTAIFEKATFTVTFEDYDGTNLKSYTATYGDSPEAPDNPTREGYTFTGWSPEFSTVTETVTYTATYEINKYTVTFVDYNGNTLSTQTVDWNTSATAPADPTREGYRFTGWDTDYSNITADTTVTAQYVQTCTVTIDITDGVSSITYTYTQDDTEIEDTVTADTTLTVDVGQSMGFSYTLAENYVAGAWYVNDVQISESAMGTPVISENSVVRYAPIRQYTVTVTEATVHGTVKINDTDYTAPLKFNENSEITLTVTPNTNYVATVTVNGTETTLTNNTATLTITADTTINVSYTDVSCKIDITDYPTSNLLIGDTYQLVVEGNDNHKGTLTYASGSKTVATVDSNGMITAVGGGTCSITVTCSDGSKDVVGITVTAPTVTAAGITGVTINDSLALSNLFTYENLPNDTDSITYDYEVTEGSAVINGDNVNIYVGDQTVEITASVLYNGNVIASGTEEFTVAKPAVTFPEDIKMYAGHTYNGLAVVCTDETPQSIAWSTLANDYATVEGLDDGTNATVTSVAVGAADIQVEVKFNDYYSITETFTVTVVNPAITTTKSSVSLSYGTGASTDVTTTTFTASVSEQGVVGECDDCSAAITAISENTEVATVSIDANGNVTVTAQSVGSTNIILSYHGVTKKVSVNVTEAETWEYIYVTDSLSWGSMKLHYWNEGGSSTEVDMVYIGDNKGNSQKVFAYRFKKGETPDYFILKKNSSWDNADECTENYEYKSTGYWIQDANEDLNSDNNTRRILGDTTWTAYITRPSVSVDAYDVTMRVGETATVTATHDGSSQTWVIDDTSIATLEGSTSNTATITGVKRGDTTATVYVPATAGGNDCSFSSFQTTTEALPYVSGSATVDVTVTRAADDKKVDIYLSKGITSMVSKDVVTPEIAGLTATKTLTSSTNSGQVTGNETALFYDNIEVYGDAIEIKYTETNADYEVAYIVVYNFNEQMFKTYEPTDMGSYVSASHQVTDDCYIYPVFFHTDEFITEHKLKKLTFSFDTTELPIEEWGMFVSCYSYDDSTSTKFFGSWPGQLMIPNDDGTYFWTQLEIPDSSQSSTYANSPDGVLFSNYLDGTIPKDYADEFGFDTDTCLQTYDYREGMTLLEEGYFEIFFKAQQNRDGYHGEYSSGSYDVSDSDTFNAKTHSPAYTYEYLLHRDQVNAMDFYGQKVSDKKSLDSADYYIISEGDVNIAAGGYTRPDGTVVNSSYNGVWSVKWHVYNSEGTHLVTMLSDAFYNETGSDDDIPVLVQELMKVEGKTSEEYQNVTIAISYEKENNNGHAGDCYDGQWYGIRSTDTMDVNVEVGLVDSAANQGTFELNAVALAGSNSSYYGLGGIVSGTDLLPTKQLTYGGDRSVTLKAENVGNYKFVGWYTFDGNEYCPLDTAKSTSVSRVQNTTTYYALFEQLGETDVIINHSKYNNPYDDDIVNEPIQEYNGDSMMSVTVVDDITGETVHSGGTANISSTTATFTALEGHTYTVTITTVPVGPDTFFAWYSDSTTVDGSPTFEEVFTRGEDVGSNETVSNTFTYDPAYNKNREINIYSCLVDVKADATLEYIYENRYGQTRVIRETIRLSDEEIKGFDGNGGKAYHPEYKDYYYTKEDKSDKAFGTTDNAEAHTGNNILSYAPNYLVTEAVHQEIRWLMTLKDDGEFERFSVTSSLAQLTAKQIDVEYTVNYTGAYVDGKETSGGTGKQPYNTLLADKYEIVTDAYNPDGVAFSYWQDADTGEIVSYNRYYSYRIVEDRNIKAVYGATSYDPWASAIENITQTREYQNYPTTIDLVYADFLLSYQNEDLLEVNNLTNVQYGLIMIRQDGYTIDETTRDSAVYPSDASKAGSIIETKVKKIVSSSKKPVNAKFKTDDGTYYYATNYNLTGSQNVTNLNRLNFVLSFDNTLKVYDKYAYSAYAYIYEVDDAGNVKLDSDNEPIVYISEVRNFNIHETANESLK